MKVHQNSIVYIGRAPFFYLLSISTEYYVNIYLTTRRLRYLQSLERHISLLLILYKPEYNLYICILFSNEERIAYNCFYKLIPRRSLN